MTGAVCRYGCLEYLSFFVFALTLPLMLSDFSPRVVVIHTLPSTGVPSTGVPSTGVPSTHFNFTANHVPYEYMRAVPPSSPYFPSDLCSRCFCCTCISSITHMGRRGQSRYTWYLFMTSNMACFVAVAYPYEPLFGMCTLSSELRM
jgi:hypothetical protein